MERLTNKTYDNLIKCQGCIEKSNCYEQSCGHIEEAISKLYKYENFEEQRLLIRLPKDGQIYHIEESEETSERWIGNKPCRYITSEGYYCGWGIGTVCFKFDEIGKTVFLTRNEAEDILNVR